MVAWRDKIWEWYMDESMVQIWDGCSRILWRQPKENTSHRERYFARTPSTGRHVTQIAHFSSVHHVLTTFLVDDKVYVDSVHNTHIYDVPANSGWVWLGDPWHPYTNPDFQIRRLYYGPRTEALKYGLVNWKTKVKYYHLLITVCFFILISETWG